MKPDELLDAFENIDDIYIKEAKMPRKPVWKIMGVIAASITLVLLLGQLSPFLRNSNMNSHSTQNQEGNQEMVHFKEPDLLPENDEEIFAPDMGVEEDEALYLGDIWIYFVDGNEIKKELVRKINPSFSNRFSLWKEKNGIGDEVELIKAYIDDLEATTSEKNGIATYIPGNYFVCYITVSANLKNYFSDIDSEKLLESLKQTMIHGSEHDMEYKAYHLTFE